MSLAHEEAMGSDQNENLEVLTRDEFDRRYQLDPQPFATGSMTRVYHVSNPLTSEVVATRVAKESDGTANGNDAAGREIAIRILLGQHIAMLGPTEDRNSLLYIVDSGGEYTYQRTLNHARRSKEAQPDSLNNLLAESTREMLMQTLRAIKAGICLRDIGFQQLAIRESGKEYPAVEYEATWVDFSAAARGGVDDERIKKAINLIKEHVPSTEQKSVVPSKGQIEYLKQRVKKCEMLVKQGSSDYFDLMNSVHIVEWLTNAQSNPYLAEKLKAKFAETNGWSSFRWNIENIQRRSLEPTPFNEIISIITGHGNTTLWREVIPTINRVLPDIGSILEEGGDGIDAKIDVDNLVITQIKRALREGFYLQEDEFIQLPRLNDNARSFMARLRRLGDKETLIRQIKRLVREQKQQFIFQIADDLTFMHDIYTRELKPDSAGNEHIRKVNYRLADLNELATKVKREALDIGYSADDILEEINQQIDIILPEFEQHF